MSSTRDLCDDLAALPKTHQSVIADCIREAWTNLDQNDAVTEADVAADIVRALSRHYLGEEA